MSDLTLSAAEPTPVPEGTRTRRRAGANEEVAPPEGARLLSFGQAAFLLQVSTTTIRRVVDEGQIRSVRVLGRTMIAREALEDFIRQHDTAKKPTSEAAIRAEAEAQALRSVRLKTRVVADWNRGGQGHGLDKPPRAPRSKTKPA